MKVDEVRPGRIGPYIDPLGFLTLDPVGPIIISVVTSLPPEIRPGDLMLPVGPPGEACLPSESYKYPL